MGLKTHPNIDILLALAGLLPTGRLSDALEKDSSNIREFARERKLVYEALFSPGEAANATEKNETSCIEEFLGKRARAMGCVCLCPKCQGKPSGVALTTAETEEKLPVSEGKAVAAEVVMRALQSVRALQRRTAEKERERLQMEIMTAEREKDQARLVKLLEAKARLAKELAQLRGK